MNDIPLSVDEIAAVVGGTVEGDGAVTVTAPVVLDSVQAEPGGLFVAFVGEYAASRADVVAVVGEGARPIAVGAGERAVGLAGNDAAVDWLRGEIAAGDVVLVKASRAADLDEVAAALG